MKGNGIKVLIAGHLAARQLEALREAGCDLVLEDDRIRRQAEALKFKDLEDVYAGVTGNNRHERRKQAAVARKNRRRRYG